MTTDQGHPPGNPDRPRIGISACLLGETVRYDGGHKRHHFLTDVLSGYVDYVALCPEAGSGMGVPRPPIQLVGRPGEEQAHAVDTPGQDFTPQLQRYASDRLPELDSISGYVFKSRSPSCGLQNVALIEQPGSLPQPIGTGVYAAALQRAMPHLPVTEEHCFDDTEQCINFLVRVHVYHRWQYLLREQPTAESLQRFHNDVRPVAEEGSARKRTLLDDIATRVFERQQARDLEAYIGHLMDRLKAARPGKQGAAEMYPEALQRYVNNISQR